MLECEIISIAKTMCDIAGIKKIYFDEVAEGFCIPSLYFPAAEQDFEGDTLTAYRYDTTLFVKVFDKTNKKAINIAEKITNNIAKHKLLIDIIDKSGEKTGKKLRLKAISCKKLDIGVAQIMVRFQTSFPYNSETYSMINTFFTNLRAKEKY